MVGRGAAVGGGVGFAVVGAAVGGGVGFAVVGAAVVGAGFGAAVVGAAVAAGAGAALVGAAPGFALEDTAGSLFFLSLLPPAAAAMVPTTRTTASVIHSPLWPFLFGAGGGAQPGACSGGYQLPSDACQ